MPVSYGAFAPSVHVTAAGGPEQVQGHSFTVGFVPVSCFVRYLAVPVGAPTRSMLPFASGLDTLQFAQALASHLLPAGASGLYGPEIWYPDELVLPSVKDVEIGHEHIISLLCNPPGKPGNCFPLLLVKQMPPSHWP